MVQAAAWKLFRSIFFSTQLFLQPYVPHHVAEPRSCTKWLNLRALNHYAKSFFFFFFRNDWLLWQVYSKGGCSTKGCLWKSQMLLLLEINFLVFMRQNMFGNESKLFIYFFLSHALVHSSSVALLSLSVVVFFSQYNSTNVEDCQLSTHTDARAPSAWVKPLQAASLTIRRSQGSRQR